MKDDLTAAELAARIEAWLDHPQSHLDDQSRRRVIELMVTSHVARVRDKEKARTRAKDFLLTASVVTLIGSSWPKISTFLGL